jgi:hypothetical protein
LTSNGQVVPINDGKRPILSLVSASLQKYLWVQSVFLETFLKCESNSFHKKDRCFVMLWRWGLITGRSSHTNLKEKTFVWEVFENWKQKNMVILVIIHRWCSGWLVKGIGTWHYCRMGWIELGWKMVHQLFFIFQRFLKVAVTLSDTKSSYKKNYIVFWRRSAYTVTILFGI